MVKLDKKMEHFSKEKKRKERREGRRKGRKKRKENGNSITFKNLESNFKILENEDLLDGLNSEEKISKSIKTIQAIRSRSSCSNSYLYCKSLFPAYHTIQ